MNSRTKTRAARRAAPNVGRAGAEVFSALAKKTKFADPALADHWPDIAGGEIARLCRPGRITGRPPGRTLEVYVPSGAAAAQVQMQVETIKAGVNRYMGPGAIARITIIQTGQDRQMPAQPAAPASDEGKSPLGAALSSFRAAVDRRNGGK